MTSPIHFEVHGTGDREIVICNGLSQSTANWRGIARQHADCRWILFDARGHGRSKLRKRPYHIDDHVEDLTYVLTHANARKPLLLGFSHGARVALRAAALHPEWFCGLMLVSCGSEITARRRAYIESWQKSLELGGLEALAWTTLPTIVGAKILEKFNDFSFLVRGTVSRNNKEGLLAVFEGMADYPPTKDDALRVTLKTLVLHGEQDPLVSRRDVDNLCSWLADAQGLSYPDCGHTLPLEEPLRFVAEVTRFMDTLHPTCTTASRRNKAEVL